MPLFVTERDHAFFTGINHELIDEIVETAVIMYSLDAGENPTNIYGENIQKLYKPGILCNALITHDDQSTQDDQFGPNVFQNITCAFHRLTLKDKDFYPERGDVVKWNDAYFEITHVIDNQLLAGRVGLPHSIICTAVMTNRSVINIRNDIDETPETQGDSTSNSFMYDSQTNTTDYDFNSLGSPDIDLNTLP